MPTEKQRSLTEAANTRNGDDELMKRFDAAVGDGDPDEYLRSQGVEPEVTAKGLGAIFGAGAIDAIGPTAGGVEDIIGRANIDKAAEMLPSLTAPGIIARLMQGERGRRDKFKAETAEIRSKAAPAVDAAAASTGSKLEGGVKALMNQDMSLFEAAQGKITAGGLAGMMTQGLSTAGVVAASRVFGPQAPLLAGGAMAAGFAADEERARFREMSLEELATVPRYQELVAEMGADRARAVVAEEAATGAARGAAAPGALSGALGGKVLTAGGRQQLAKFLPKGKIAKAGTGLVAGAAVEGLEEVAELVGAQVGSSLATGEDRNIGEGGELAFVGGALTGAPIGAVGGFMSKRADAGDAPVSPAPPTPPPPTGQLEQAINPQPAVAPLDEGPPDLDLSGLDFRLDEGAPPESPGDSPDAPPDLQDGPADTLPPTDVPAPSATSAESITEEGPETVSILESDVVRKDGKPYKTAGQAKLAAERRKDVKDADKYEPVEIAPGQFVMRRKDDVGASRLDDADTDPAARAAKDLARQRRTEKEVESNTTPSQAAATRQDRLEAAASPEPGAVLRKDDEAALHQGYGIIQDRIDELQQGGGDGSLIDGSLEIVQLLETLDNLDATIEATRASGVEIASPERRHPSAFEVQEAESLTGIVEPSGTPVTPVNGPALVESGQDNAFDATIDTASAQEIIDLADGPDVNLEELSLEEQVALLEGRVSDFKGANASRRAADAKSDGGERVPPLEREQRVAMSPEDAVMDLTVNELKSEMRRMGMDTSIYSEDGEFDELQARIDLIPEAAALQDSLNPAYQAEATTDPDGLVDPNAQAQRGSVAGAGINVTPINTPLIRVVRTPEQAAARREMAERIRVLKNLPRHLRHMDIEELAASLQALEDEVRRIAGKHVKLDFVELLNDGRTDLAGMYFPDRNLILMSFNALDPFTTIWHEAFHAAQNLIFTHAQLDILHKAFLPDSRQHRILVETLRANRSNPEFAAIRPDLSNPLEAQAYAFELWKRGMFEPSNVIARLWQKVHAFIEAVGNTLRGNGFQTAQDVFTLFDSGALAASARKPKRDQTPFVDMSVPVAQRMSEQLGTDPELQTRATPVHAGEGLGAIDATEVTDVASHVYTSREVEHGPANRFGADSYVGHARKFVTNGTYHVVEIFGAAHPRILHSEIQNAINAGHTTFRVAHASTVAHVGGWYREGAPDASRINEDGGITTAGLTPELLAQAQYYEQQIETPLREKYNAKIVRDENGHAWYEVELANVNTGVEPLFDFRRQAVDPEAMVASMRKPGAVPSVGVHAPTPAYALGDPYRIESPQVLYQRGNVQEDTVRDLVDQSDNVIEKMGLTEALRTSVVLSYFGKGGDVVRTALESVPLIGKMARYMSENYGLNTILHLVNANKHITPLLKHKENLMEQESIKNRWRTAFDSVAQRMMRLTKGDLDALGEVLINETLTGERVDVTAFNALPEVVRETYTQVRQSLSGFMNAMKVAAIERIERQFAGTYTEADQQLALDAALEKLEARLTPEYLDDQKARAEEKFVQMIRANPKLTEEGRARSIATRMKNIDELYANDGAAFKALAIKSVTASVTKRFEAARAQRTSMLDQTNAEFERLGKKPFFPLARFGEYTLEYRDAEGQYVFELHETPMQLSASKAAARKAGAVELKAGKLDAEIFESGAVVAPIAVLRNAEKMNLSPAAMQQLQQLAFMAANPASFLKHRLRQKGVQGFSTDLIRAYANYGMTGSSYLARVSMFDILEADIQAVRDFDTGNEDDQIRISELANNLGRKLENTLMPGEEWGAARQVGFIVSLAAVPKAALVNLTGMYMMGVMDLSARYGAIKAHRHWGKAVADVRFDDDGNIIIKDQSRGLSKALKMAMDAGIISQSMISEIGNLASTGPEGWRFKKIGDVPLGRIFHTATVMFSKAEEINRNVIFTMTYRMEMEKHGDETLAYEVAIGTIQRTMFEYARWNRPDVIRGPVKGTIFQFKNFSIQYVKLLFAGMGKAASKEERLASLYMFSALVVMGGLQGLPFAEDLLDVLDMIGTDKDSRFDSRKSGRELMKRVMTDDAADILLHGATRGTPFDLSGSMSVGRQIPGLEAAASAETSGSELSAVELISKNLGPTITWAGKVLSAAASEDPDAWKNYERAMPNFMRHPSQALRWATRGEETDRTGRVIRKDFTLPELAGKAIGFQPTSLSKTREEMWYYNSEDRFYTARSSILMKNLHHDLINNDARDSKKIMSEIEKFNMETVRTGNEAYAITMDTIRRSMTTRERKRAMLVPRKQYGRFSQESQDE